MYNNIHVLVCKCGWQTAATEPPSKCAACGSPSATGHKYLGQTAEVVATIMDIRDKRIQEHADQSDLIVHQLSKQRWIVLRRIPGASFTSYGDSTARAFHTSEVVFGPNDHGLHQGPHSSTSMCPYSGS